LDGSVRRSGATVRVTVQLVETSHDTPVWAEKYGGTIEDVFAIQETISRSISTALQLKLAAVADRRFAQRRRGSAAAYEVYLSTRADVESWSLPRLERARGRLERALAEMGPDPYLYRGLGRVAWQYLNGGFSREPVHHEQMDDYIRRLEELEPGSAHAAVLRALRASTMGDPGAWYRAILRAEAADPSDTESTEWKSLLLLWSGRGEESKAVASALAERDPLNEYVWFSRCLAAQMEGRFEDARRVGERGLADHPDSTVWPTVLVQLCAMTGDLGGARAIVAASLPDALAGGFASLGHLLLAALEGDAAQASRIATPEFESLMWHDHQYAHFMAQAHSLLGRHDEAFRWLERAVERGFVHQRFLADVDPLLAPLRGQARFTALMERVSQASEAFPGETNSG
jgi:non-specific serine/threonine protein kinase